MGQSKNSELKLKTEKKANRQKFDNSKKRKPLARQTNSIPTLNPAPENEKNSSSTPVIPKSVPLPPSKTSNAKNFADPIQEIPTGQKMEPVKI